MAACQPPDIYTEKNENHDIWPMISPSTLYPNNLKKFLGCHACLKLYQNFFQVSALLGTWFFRGLKMSILAILLDLYIIIADK